MEKIMTPPLRFIPRLLILAMLFGFAPAISVCAAAEDTFVQPLISAERSLNIETWQITSAEVTPDCPAHWAFHKYALHGGKQEGVDLIVLNNGKLRMIVVPTRGMNVLSVTDGGVRLGWDSPVTEVVNPRNINLSSRGGLGWLEGFNEWLVRCGLEYAGHPGTDKFINNVGDPATMDLTLHGRIGNTPASEVELVVEKKPPFRIHLRGRVDERMFYGPKLEIWTDLSTEPGSESFRIEDAITNRGPENQEFEIIYHTNYGKPLLEEGSTFVGAVGKLAPFNANAARGLDSWPLYAGPTPGFIEQVYNITPLADADGTTSAMLRNRGKDKAIVIAWNTHDLPCFSLWKNTTSEGDGYVTGLEPGTNFAYNRRLEREAGRLQKLSPGATHRAHLDFTIAQGADAVARAAARIEKLQATHPPTIEPKPLQTE
jgi:hypothetical protein